VVCRAGEALDFGALDSEPVDLLFLLLSPPDAQNLHLRLLARLSRIFSSQNLLERLRRAPGPKEVLRLLREEDARHVY
jgi:PTS system nitrogen regulatory IIA component